MRRVPLKNYVILSVIILSTVICVFYFRGWYITTKEYYSKNSVIRDVVREINAYEISNYTLESPKFMLYVSSGTNNDVKKFENRFKKIIKKYELGEDVLYLNTDNVDLNVLYSNLNGFSSNNKISSLIVENKSSLYIFDEGKIIVVLNNLDSFSDFYIEKFLRKWGFIND